MNYQEVIEKMSEIGLRISILIAFVGLAKVFMINFFLLKITQAKKSEIKFSKNGKTASFSSFEDQPEKVINIYRTIDNDEDDLFKAS